MSWIVEMHPDFIGEYTEFSENVQICLLSEIEFLEKYGPYLKRPHSDTLNGSKFKNLKELRFKTDNEVWRVAYAFDPERKAILLVAGNKSGIKEKLFYRQLIIKADQRFTDHLKRLKDKDHD